MMYVIIIALVLALLYYIFFRTGLVFMFLDVSGLSMYPTLQDGEQLFSVRTYLCRPVEVGDIVVARPKACGGDKLVIKRVHSKTFSPYLQTNTYYILGDNADESHDSRDYGWITEKEIVAKVMMNKSQ